MAEAGGEGEYDAEEEDDDTEESSDDGDADVDDESPAAPPQLPQPPRSIMKTIFGRLLGRRASEVTHQSYCMTHMCAHIPAHGTVPA